MGKSGKGKTDILKRKVQKKKNKEKRFSCMPEKKDVI